MFNTLSPEVFDQLVRKHYDFLESDYGFSFQKINNRRYEITSSDTNVVVLVEGDALAVEIKPIGEGASQLLKQNILPEGMEVFVIAECLDSNFHYVGTSIDGDKWVQDIPVELEERANLLQKYCTMFLKGDYSQWVSILKCLE